MMLLQVGSAAILQSTPDARFHGPPLSPFTWARQARESTRALLTDRQSDANWGWHSANSEGRTLFSERSTCGNGLVTVSEHGPWRCLKFDDDVPPWLNP